MDDRTREVGSVPPGFRLPKGKQWIAHDSRGGRAARRRLEQMARGKIDPAQMSESAKVVAPMLREGGTQERLDRVNALIEKETGAAPGSLSEKV